MQPPPPPPTPQAPRWLSVAVASFVALSVGLLAGGAVGSQAFPRVSASPSPSPVQVIQSVPGPTVYLTPKVCEQAIYGLQGQVIDLEGVISALHTGDRATASVDLVKGLDATGTVSANVKACEAAP